MVDDLGGRGVGLRALHGEMDTTDPIAGPITLYVLAALAEADGPIIVERTRGGPVAEPRTMSPSTATTVRPGGSSIHNGRASFLRCSG